MNHVDAPSGATESLALPNAPVSYETLRRLWTLADTTLDYVCSTEDDATAAVGVDGGLAPEAGDAERIKLARAAAARAGLETMLGIVDDAIDHIDRSRALKQRVLARMDDYRASKITQRQLAAELGVSPSTVLNYISMCGGGRSVAKLPSIADLRDGKRVSLIARESQSTTSSIYSALQRHGFRLRNGAVLHDFSRLHGTAAKRIRYVLEIERQVRALQAARAADVEGGLND